MYYILAPHRRGGCWLKAQNNGQHDNVYAVSGPRTCSGIPQDFGLNKLNAICFFLECGGHLMESAGDLSSSNFPSPYDSDQNCVWLIEVGNGHYIDLKFRYFQVGPKA